MISSATALPLRLLLIAMLMAALTFASDGHCADHAASTALASTPAVLHVEHPHTGSGHHGTDRHGGLLRLCMGVLAAIATALLLIGAPGQLRAMLTRLRATAASRLQIRSCAPALSLLCVSRT